MEKKPIKKQRNIAMISLSVFIFLFILGNLMFYYTPNTISRQYDLTMTTADGVEIHFDLYEPKSSPGSEKHKNAVILGHGFIVNKHVMRLMAIELANAGFVVLAFDFRSHGQSDGDFQKPAQGVVDAVTGEGNDSSEVPFDLDILRNEVIAAKQYLKKRGDINMTNLGYAGYSMGGGVGFLQVTQDPSFRAMVGISPLTYPELVNTTNPQNLMIIIGKYDEAVSFEGVMETMENKTGIPADKIENGKIYGNFQDGTAARLYIDNAMEHFLAPFDHHFVIETRNWFVQALLDEDASDSVFLYSMLFLWLSIQFISALGIFALVSHFVLKRQYQGESNSKSQIKTPELNSNEIFISTPVLEKNSQKVLLIKGVLYILLLSHISMLLILPLYLTPMLINAFEIMLLFGPSLAILFLLRRLYKQAGISLITYFAYWRKMTTWKEICIALGLGVFLNLLLAFSIGHSLDIIPGMVKWPWVPVFALVTGFCFFCFISFFQPLMMEQNVKNMKDQKAVLKMALENYAVNMFVCIYVLGLPAILLNNYFIVMFLIPMGIILALVSFIATYYYTYNKNILISTITVTVFITNFFCSMGPMVFLPDLL